MIDDVGDDADGNDPRQLRPGDLPTPFTAAEIRDATRDGHTVETITEEGGSVAARERFTFSDGDADAVTMRHVAWMRDGEPVSVTTVTSMTV